MKKYLLKLVLPIALVDGWNNFGTFIFNGNYSECIEMGDGTVRWSGGESAMSNKP